MKAMPMTLKVAGCVAIYLLGFASSCRQRQDSAAAARAARVEAYSNAIAWLDKEVEASRPQAANGVNIQARMRKARAWLLSYPPGAITPVHIIEDSVVPPLFPRNTYLLSLYMIDWDFRAVGFVVQDQDGKTIARYNKGFPAYADPRWRRQVSRTYIRAFDLPFIVDGRKLPGDSHIIALPRQVLTTGATIRILLSDGSQSAPAKFCREQGYQTHNREQNRGSS